MLSSAISSTPAPTHRSCPNCGPPANAEENSPHKAIGVRRNAAGRTNGTTNITAGSAIRAISNANRIRLKVSDMALCVQMSAGYGKAWR
jgi:hypothetical protein